MAEIQYVWLDSLKYMDSYWKALDSVAREERYIMFLEGPSKESTKDFLKQMIERGVPFLFAVDGEKVVGWCDINPNTHIMTSHSANLGMAVIASHRGKGIGRQLISRGLERARAKGIEKVDLEVFADNEKAISLYEKVGFEKEGHFKKYKKYKGEYIDCIRMALFL